MVRSTGGDGPSYQAGVEDDDPMTGGSGVSNKIKSDSLSGNNSSNDHEDVNVGFVNPSYANNNDQDTYFSDETVHIPYQDSTVCNHFLT